MTSAARPRFHRFAVTVLKLIVLLLAVDTAWVVALWVWSESVVRAPMDTPPDAIAVLYSDFGPDLKRTARSLDRALALRRVVQPLPDLLCIGGNRHLSGQRWGDAMVTYLVGRGVSRNTIASDQHSYDTRTNIRAVLGLAKERELNRILIVAHPAHAPRVMHHWRVAGGHDRMAIAHPVALNTAAGVMDFWITAQHEALSWLALSLPDALEDGIIRWVRR